MSNISHVIVDEAHERSEVTHLPLLPPTMQHDYYSMATSFTAVFTSSFSTLLTYYLPGRRLSSLRAARAAATRAAAEGDPDVGHPRRAPLLRLLR